MERCYSLVFGYSDIGIALNSSIWTDVYIKYWNFRYINEMQNQSSCYSGKFHTVTLTYVYKTETSVLHESSFVEEQLDLPFSPSQFNHDLFGCQSFLIIKTQNRPTKNNCRPIDNLFSRFLALDHETCTAQPMRKGLIRRRNNKQCKPISRYPRETSQGKLKNRLQVKNPEQSITRRKW